MKKLTLYINTFTKGLFIIWQQKETLHFKQWISTLIRKDADKRQQDFVRI